MGMGGQHHVPAALPPVKTRYPWYNKLVGPQGRSGGEWKISPPHDMDSRTVQHVAIPTELSLATMFKGLILNCYKPKCLMAPRLETRSLTVISVRASNFDLKWFQTDRCSSRPVLGLFFFYFDIVPIKGRYQIECSGPELQASCCPL